MARPYRTYGPWEPDRADGKVATQEGSTVLIQAKGVRPVKDGYEPFPDLAAACTQAMDGTIIGIGSFLDKSDGAGHIFLIDDTGDVSEVTSPSALTARGTGFSPSVVYGQAKFTQFGDIAIIATGSGGETLLTADMTTSNAFSTAGITNSPRAEHIGTFRDFVVVGNTADAESQVRWCQINDYTDWTIGTDQADEQTFPDGGPIQAMHFHDVGYILQRSMVRRMTYVAPNPAIFRFDVIEPGRGVRYPNSFAALGRLMFWFADDGFRMSDGSGPSKAIGYERVDEFFRADVSESDRNLISAVVDQANSLYLIGYKSESAGGSTPDRILAYNYVLDRWSGPIEIDHQILHQTFSYGSSVDDITQSIDASPYDVLSLDDPYFEGGLIQMSGATPDNEFGLFNGSNVQATIETVDIDLGEGRKVHVKGSRPVVDAALSSDLSTYISGRETLGASTSFTSAVTPNNVGYAINRKRGRYFRHRLIIAAGADWSRAQGIEWDFIKSGMH